MVFGTELCADISTYTRYEDAISGCLHNLENVELAETNELGRLNKVDPLGITDFRIRGMWLLKNPFEVYRYVYRVNEHNKFNFMALINNEKFNNISNHDELIKLSKTHKTLAIKDVEIKDPNNPALLNPCKLITFCIER